MGGKINYKVIDGLEYKQCAGCKNFFLLNTDNFYANSKLTSKFNSRCKECMSKDKKEIYKKQIRERIYTKWDDNKIKLFKKLYATTSNKDLGIILNTTLKSLESQAVRMELKKTKQTISESHRNGHIKKNIYKKEKINL